MSTEAELVARLHEASPAVARGTGGNDSLQKIRVRLDPKLRLLPSDGEQVLAVWGCGPITGFVSIDESGHPLPPGKPLPEGANVRTGQVFSGMGLLELTDRRLVGTMGDGSSLLGKVSMKDSDAVVFAVPLTDIVEMGISRKKGVFGTKEVGLSVQTRAGGALALSILQTVQGPKGAGEAAGAILAAAAAARGLASAPEWRPDGDDLRAELEA